MATVKTAIKPEPRTTIYEPRNRYSYYPGCSLLSSAAEYDHSTQAVFGALGVELSELPDWNCCGASSAHAVDHILALALPLRNLAIAEAMGADVAVPCAACFSRLKNAEYKFRNDDAVRRELREIVSEPYEGKITVRHSMDILLNDIGLEAIQKKIVHPLKGLKVVCYYGCLLVRPPKVTGADNPDNPVFMDTLLRALGADPINWNMKTECCGAGHALTRTDIVEQLVGKIVKMANIVGADAIVTACPMCHANLDMRQENSIMNPEQGIPVFYFSELMAVAMGLKGAAVWLNKHIIPALPLLKKLEIPVSNTAVQSNLATGI
ncbi:MAG: CoB--CoM heterodisulfide reductase iron-sulfur subunit B family protein [bacterium]